MNEPHVASRKPVRARVLGVTLLVAASATIAFVAVRASTSAPDKPIVVAPPSGGELPKFGDYVDVDELPEAVERTHPKYPTDWRQDLSATVLVQALVGKDGRVHDTRIVKSVPLLDQAAIECVRQWVFKPALSNGQPVAVWVAVPVRFGGSGAPSGNSTPAPAPDTRLAPPKTREGAAWKAADSRAALDDLITQLRSAGPYPPSEGDALLRERIIRAARRSPPEVPMLARQTVEGLLSSHAPPDVRLRALLGALDAAPWWSVPYREIGLALVELDRRGEARVSLELYLVAEPDAEDWESVRLMLNELRRSPSAAK